MAASNKENPCKKPWIAVLGGAAAVLALMAPAAQAGTSVHLSIGVPLPVYGYGYGGYYPQPTYVVTGPRYVVPQTYYYGGGHRYDRGHRHFRGDRDRDGIPNRWDRDRDGDGVPNRWDRHPGNGHRR
jgi:hypothetical protein